MKLRSSSAAMMSFNGPVPVVRSKNECQKGVLAKYQEEQSRGLDPVV